MRTVRVNRLELLEKVRKNRESHRSLFEQAQVGFRDEAIRVLDQMLEDARRNRPIRLYVGLDQPEDHTSDYDTVIAMLEMSVEDVVELQYHEFERFVLDKWEWSAETMVKNSRYVGLARERGLVNR